MAWDALAGRFKQKMQEDQNLGQEFKPLATGGQSSGGATFNPTPNPTGGFGGYGGEQTAGPASARFVNYGDLYAANKDKAEKMASDVYRGAEKKAEDAKGAVAGAEKTFAEKAAANAGNWRPIQGQHGTRIENKTGGPSGGADQGWNNYSWEGGTATRREGSEGGTGTRGLQQPGASSTSAGASRYGQLFGQQSGLESGWNPDKAESARDYHHSVSELEAKSGAGQDYTGPSSLKDAIGEDAYGKLAGDVKGGVDAVAGLQNAGGIADALGYAGNQTGNSALDTGLTQTAGQSNFKRLADRYSNLGKTLDDAQTNSIADAGRADAASQVAAKDWQDMLAEFEANKPKDPNAPIIIGAAGSTAGRVSGSETGKSRDANGPATNPGAATGADNADSKYSGTNSTYNSSMGGQAQGGLWPSGITHDPERDWRNANGTDDEVQWQTFWASVPEATKEWLSTLTPAERQKWADDEWAKQKGGG